MTWKIVLLKAMKYRYLAISEIVSLYGYMAIESKQLWAIYLMGM